MPGPRGVAMAGLLHRSHPQLPQKQNAGCRSFDSSSGMNCHDPGCISPQVLSVYLETGTAKYAVRPIIGSIALPVISPLSFISFALARTPEKPPLKSLRSEGTLL